MDLSCRPLRDDDVPALAALCERGLPADSYLLDALDHGGVAGFLGAFEGGRLAGAAVVRRGGIALSAATPPAAARALVPSILSRGPWSSVVGPEVPSREIVRSLRGTLPFRVDRVQAFMAVARGDPLGPGHPGLRRAAPSDLEELVPLVAAYRLEDGLARPDDEHTTWIRSHSSERIAAGHMFVVEEGGRIVFTGAFNYAGRRGSGLGGIYTLPEARGRGIASRATADICRVALGMGPVATLHVDPRNAPAVRAYEKAGLRRAGEFRLTFR